MSESRALTQSKIEAAAAIADEAAARTNVDRYLRGKAENTRKAQEQDLAAFAMFLENVTGAALDLENVNDWRGVTWGLIAAFVEQQLHEGYAVATVARRLATLRKRAKLAYQAGVIDREQHAMILTCRLPPAPRESALTPSATRNAAAARKPIR